MAFPDDLWIASSYSGNIYHYEKDSIVGNPIVVGDNKPQGVLVSQDGRTIYTANRENSKISIKEVASCPDAAINKRKNAIENNLLISDGNYYILQEDMEFKSLSGAACFVSGTSVNGKTAWKTTQKQTSGHKSEAKTAGDGGISSKINQICMVVRKVKEEPAPIDNYTKTLAVIYGDVAAELNIGKSSVVDKCQRQLNLSAMEFAKYLKDFIDSGSDKLHEIVLNQAKNQEERELIDKTFAG